MALASKAASFSRFNRSDASGHRANFATRRRYANESKEVSNSTAGNGKQSRERDNSVATTNRDRGVKAAAPDFWDPLSDVDRAFRQMEKFMRNPWRMPLMGDDLMGPIGAGETPAESKGVTSNRWWKPAVDIAEASDKYVIHAELPGLSKSDVKVSIDEGVLTLHGERNIEKKDEDTKHKYTRVERQYGSFTRRFTLPRDVDTTGVKATFKDGILEITVPRAADKTATEVRIE